MTPPIRVSNSEIQTFMDCRRRWYLSYYRRLGKKERSFSGPLALGSRVHKALENYYNSKGPLLDEWKKLVVDDRALLDSSYRDPVDFENEAELGRIMLEGYLEWNQNEGIDSELEVISNEQRLMLPLFNGDVELMAKIDQRVRRKSDGVRLYRDWKPQPLTEPVATPDGWTTMGALKPGDYVLGQGFKPTKVLQVFDRGEDDVYLITFNDGTSTRATADHPWVVERLGRAMQLRTDQLLEKSLPARIKPIAVEVTSDTDLSIDPYVLGAWLGDGCRETYTRGTQWTRVTDENRKWWMKIGVGEKEVARALLEHTDHELETVLPSDGRPYKKPFYVVRLNIGVKLETLGLMDKHSGSRWIPAEYLRAGYNQRLALLRGLMDTDGHVGSHQNTVDFSSTSEQLSNDVAELVRSLGGWARVVKSKTGNGYTTPDGDRVMTGSWSWRVVIRIGVNPFEHNPARAGRWLEKQAESESVKPDRLRAPRRMDFKRDKLVKSVEHVGREQVRCIKVEADDCLYLTNGLTLTHNTTANFADLTRTAHLNEQFLTYQVIEAAQKDETERCEGALITMLKKVKRTASARPPFYEQIEVRHNVFALRNFWTRLHGKIGDMMNVRRQLDAGVDHHLVAYPSPGRECTWKCDFFAVCPLFDDGSAVEQAVHELYIEREPYEYYSDGTTQFGES